MPDDPKMLKETVNGPTVADEELLLRALFGEPAEDGFFYGNPGASNGDD